MASEQFIIKVTAEGAKRAAGEVKSIGTAAKETGVAAKTASASARKSLLSIGTAANGVRGTLAFLRGALVAIASIRIVSGLVQPLATFTVHFNHPGCD